jgi:AcrR family transcriptional regulator
MDQEGSPPHRPYHHGNLRAALIEAGLSALERTDQADFSLRAVAREVGVSANAAYRHFANKDDLLGALGAEGFRRFAAQQAQATQACKDARDIPAATAKAYVGFAQAHPALFRLMFSRFLYVSGSSELKEAAAAAFQQLLLASAREIGVSADHPSAMLRAIANWSTVHGLSHLMLDGQLALFEVFGLKVDAIIDGIIAQRAPHPQTP